MFNFRIQKDLRDRWFIVVIQHVNLFLMPLRGHFTSARVSLFSVEESNRKAVLKVAATEGSPEETAHDATGQQLYTCAVKISGMDEIRCENAEPLVAIAQAMARTKRHLTRRLTMRDPVAS